ncbi:hypothetical protein Tco_0634390, partial [Tanacetum coccineum]
YDALFGVLVAEGLEDGRLSSLS